MCYLDRWTWLKSALLLPVIFLVSGCKDESSPPVKVIVPFAPGGGSDTLARVLVREIEEQNDDSSWAIINVAGAGGTIGSRRVKGARPDGKTLLFLHDGILTAKYAGQALYGPEAFEPVAVTGRLGMVICVAESSEHDSLEKLLEVASDSPDSVTFAANIGAPSYFMARQLEQAHGKASFRYVQSGGGARRFADLSGGHVEVTAFSVSEFLNFRGGGIRALAILDRSRHPSLESVPTATEIGLPITYSNLQAWWAPLNTPPEEIEALQDILKKAMATQRMQDYFEEQCIDPLYLDSEKLKQAMESKAEVLGSLDLGFARDRSPPIELALGILFLTGVLLALKRPESQFPGLKTSGGYKPLFLASLVLIFVASLALPGSHFLFAGMAFVFLVQLLTVGTTQLRQSLLSAFFAPLVLYLFLSVLLKIDLP